MTKCYIIPVQEQCPNKCCFCISKTRNYNKSQAMLLVDESFKNQLERLKWLGIRKFEITGGGEPLLNPDLQLIIDSIKAAIPDAYIKLYTGGGLLKQLANVDEIDLSVTHYNILTNNSLMGNPSQKPLLEKIAFYKKDNVKLRLSILLLKGSIDNSEELERLIKISNSYVDEYVVRTLYPGSQHPELRVDFSFEHPKVKFERDNNVDHFDGLILWSDGNIYRNWSLEEVINIDSIRSENQTRIRNRKY